MFGSTMDTCYASSKVAFVGVCVLVGWFGLVWSVLVCFGLFWFVLVCFGVFWCVLVCFGVVWCGLVREVLKALSQDWVQQRIWSRSLALLLLIVLKVFSQDRVLLHPVVCMTALMMEFKGFFALFHR